MGIGGCELSVASKGEVHVDGATATDTSSRSIEIGQCITAGGQRRTSVC